MPFSRSSKQRYDAKEQLIGPDAMRHHERIIMLSVLDQQWKDHLLSMDHLREGIGLRGYGQHDPLVEYKRESFDMFEAMMERFEEETVRYLYLMQVIERREDGGSYSSGGPVDGGTGSGLAGGPGVRSRGTAVATASSLRAGRPRWTTWKKRSSGASGVSWSRRAWQARASRSRCSRSCAATRWDVTILARAAAARNTRSAAEP